MATLTAQSSTEQRERLFFFIMALAIAATVVFAFGMWFVIGNSSLSLPWHVHLHAVSFMGWIALYVTQSTLILRNDITLHRKLGWVGAGLATWMVLLGFTATANSLASGRSPPFFTPQFFLALDWVNIILFGSLVAAAIANRRRTDWHRRLMLCATISVTGPAWGRILVWQGAMTAWTNVAALLAYVVVAMIADRIIRGRVHVAYLWGFAAIVGWGVSIELLQRVPPFIALADRLAP